MGQTVKLEWIDACHAGERGEGSGKHLLFPAGRVL
jgi:hypothetical protein